MGFQYLGRLLITGAMLVSLSTSLWGYEVRDILQHQSIGFDELDEVSAVTASGDGRFVYAAGLAGLMVMERDEVTGRLSPVEALKAEFGFDVYGIRSLQLSPDERHLYAAGSLTDALAIFERDSGSGRLTFIDRVDDVDNVGDLRGAWEVIVDPQGRHVYVAANRGHEILAFERNATNGTLAVIDNEDLASTPNLRFPTRLALASGGQFLYVVANGSIGMFTRDVTTGTLELSTIIAPADLGPLSRAVDLVIDSSNNTAYIYGTLPTFPQTAIVRSVLDEATGAFDPMETLVDAEGAWQLDTSSHLVLAAGGDRLYATAGFEGKSLVSFARATDGTLSHLQTLTDGVDGIDGLDEPWEPVVSADGRHLYVPAENDESVAVFEHLAGEGVRPVEVVKDGQDALLDGLDNPYFMVVPQDGKDLYVLGWDNEDLAHYRRSPNGALSLVGAVPLRTFVDSEVARFRFLYGSPDGRFLVARGDDGLLFFARQQDGSLNFLSFVDPVGFLDRLVFGPRGRYVFMSDDENTLNVFELDGTTGALSLRHEVFRSGDSFESLAVDPSGRFLYAGGGVAGSNIRAEIILYELDFTTGEPTFVDTMDVAGGIGRRFWEIAVTPDERHLVALSSGTLESGEPGVVVFSRDLATGRLTEIQRLQDGVGAIDRFRRPRDLAISADGLRMAMHTNGTMNILQRDSNSGQLSILEQKESGGIDQPVQLVGRGGMALSPEGQQIYMTTTFYDSLLVWDSAVSTCIESPTTLCLGDDGRFRVTVSWQDFSGQTGVGTKVTESADSALFWFFDPANWEMLVKVIDGCAFNGHFWVFAAATTNVEYTLRVTDTVTNLSAVYDNPLGESAAAITDTEALLACP